jgi:hypothetical protein
MPVLHDKWQLVCGESGRMPAAVVILDGNLCGRRVLYGWFLICSLNVGDQVT